jgi:hypothetical protein
VLGKRGPEFYDLMLSRGRPQYAAIDLIWLNGRDLRERPYTRRKASLRTFLAGTPAIAIDEHRESELFEAAVGMDLEGIVANRKSDLCVPNFECVKVKNCDYAPPAARRASSKGCRSPCAEGRGRICAIRST